jgi:hypothetical protein
MPVLSLSKWPASLIITKSGNPLSSKLDAELALAGTKNFRPGTRMARSYNMNLFNRDGLGKIAWFVHICALLQGNVIGQQLQWNGMQNRA